MSDNNKMRDGWVMLRGVWTSGNKVNGVIMGNILNTSCISEMMVVCNISPLQKQLFLFLDTNVTTHDLLIGISQLSLNFTCQLW